MPRTKRPAAKKVKPIEDTEAVKKLDRYVGQVKSQIDLLAQKTCRDIDLSFKILAESLGPEMMQRTIGDLKSEKMVLKDVTNTWCTRNSTATTQSASQDDANARPPSTVVGRATGRRSRSADTRKVMQTVTKSKQTVRSKSVNRTPAYNKTAATNFPAITPKKSEMVLKEVTNTRCTRNSTATTQSASQDDGYQTEGSSQRSGGRSTTGKRTMANARPPSTVGRATGRRSRSADTRKVTQTVTKSKQTVRSKSVYRTPAYNKTAATNFPAITPKMAPNTPMAVMRQLRQGEMVVSMSGSPVLVPTYNVMQQSEKANCNIMLDDGTVLFLKPNHLRQSSSYIPFSLMGASVLEQLKTLKDNLDTVVRIGEKTIAKEM